MRPRFFRSLGALALAIPLAWTVGVTAQGQTASARKTASASKTWTPPRMPDGHPDLRGVWANNSVTPLERPKQWAGKKVLTDDELAELKTLTAEVVEGDQDAVFGDSLVLAALEHKKNPISYDPGTGNYNNFWLAGRDVEDHRTSLITDPEDGRLPSMTPAARARQAAAAAQKKQHPFDNPEDLALGERCVNFGVPKLGAGYNNYYQIVQSPGYVVMMSEMAHDARIIPLDGRSHLNDNIRLWNGDPRGRWEGDTLVVETTNFSPKSEFRGSHENLRLVERFTLVGPTTLNYDVTVTDPTTWTKPWTAMVPLKGTDDAIYEYACHEGNHAMIGILKGHRVQEKEVEDGVKSRPR